MGKWLHEERERVQVCVCVCGGGTMPKQRKMTRKGRIFWSEMDGFRNQKQST